jgi:hypothetical protein
MSFKQTSYSLTNERDTLGRAAQMRSRGTENTSGMCCHYLKLMFLG